MNNLSWGGDISVVECLSFEKSEERLHQCFPNFLGLRHLAEGKYSLRHPVESPQQFALGYDDILKILFLMIC